jgi:hypothetical protein
MADIRIKDLALTASSAASDDFMALDGASNGTRKMSAATPAFLTSVTTPSLTSPASTNLTLGTGTGGTALTLASSTLAATFAGALNSNNETPLTFAATPTAGNVLGKQGTTGSSLFVNTAGASAPYGSGLGVDGTYSSFISTINIRALGTFSGGGYEGKMAFYTSLGTAQTQRMLLSSTGLDVTGAATISSTTAGSSGAGALVVAGGISAGQSAQASYFGGNVSISGPAKATLVLNSADGATNGSAVAFVSDGSYKWIVKTASYTDGSLFTIGTATGVFTSTPVLSLNYSTAAATFAGAVAIGNTVGAAVAVASTHKVTVVIGGVTYYLLATNVP